MNIQDECSKIHSKYGMSEMANYKIQLLFDSEIEKVKKEYEEKLRWIPIEEKLPEISSLEKYNVVNVKFKTFKTDEEMVCSATLEEISQHCFENSPKHKRWFIFPSAGHELKTVTHWRSFL